jgi:hypothetical protein
MYIIKWREPDINAGPQYDCYVPEIFTDEGYVRNIQLAKKFETEADAQAYVNTYHYAESIRRSDGMFGWQVTLFVQSK